jgi:CIC family chloride channel protein
VLRHPRELAPLLWWVIARTPSWLSALLRPSVGQLELRLLGRTLILAAVVGLFGGLVGAFFVGALERLQGLLLDRWAGAGMLRAVGEPAAVSGETLRVWLLALLPAAGGLFSGLISRVAPEVAGGGGDAAISTFHRGGVQRRRVLPLKWLASVAALSTGGAGGREGPALHMGSAIGGLVGSLLPASPRERRVLLIAGMAAAMSAVFRTPLGAALLAAEVVYRDDFEAEAVVPAVIASVVAFSTSEAIVGQRALFGRLPAHPFHAAQLPLYVVLAVLAGLAGLLLVRALGAVRGLAARSTLPRWAWPAAGGLLLGLAVLGLHYSPAERLLGLSPASALLGGGYGVAQVAVTPGSHAGWSAAGILLCLAVLRIAATALTVGSGASAGDFAPSLVVGALVGGAFGHAAQTLLGDPTISPGAFALVGMATLFAGIAHVPVSAVVLVSELAGSYDLLVPLMLAAGGAHVALRRVSLYGGQATSRGAAPPREAAHGEEPGAVALVRDVMAMHGFAVFSPDDPFSTLLLAAAAGDGQVIFPVVDSTRKLLGIVDSSVLFETEALSGLRGAVASNLAGAPGSVAPDAPLHLAVAEARRLGLPQLPVCQGGRLIGMFSVEGAVRLHAVERLGVRPIGAAP